MDESNWYQDEFQETVYPNDHIVSFLSLLEYNPLPMNMSQVQILLRISAVGPDLTKAGPTAEARQTFKSRDISVRNEL